MAAQEWHNIVVCCDGTWCGAETDTRTNIQILADAFASQGQPHPVHVLDNQKPAVYNAATNTHIAFFNGVGTSGHEDEDEGAKDKERGPLGGVMGGFLDLLVYCANGALATDLDKRCKEAYKFIKDHYQGPGKSRIFLFGLSRGAWTVRAVAGMINNCGIIKNTWPQPGTPDFGTLDPTEAQERLLDAVWHIYTSNDEDCHPRGDTAKAFKDDESKVWPKGNTPPIRFMGLLDTVGAVGLPRLDKVIFKPVTPVGYDYKFRDYAVSGEVQDVFQACSTHDRLAPFQPCYVRRAEQYLGPLLEDGGTSDTGPDQDSKGSKKPPRTYRVVYKTEEIWYPGAHYDLGRQDFVFSNQKFSNAFNEVVNVLRTNVNCLPELADYPLVGYELNPATGSGHTSTTLPADGPIPPSIVARVCAIDPSLLPPPSEVDTWRTLVKGSQLQGTSTVFTKGALAVKLGLSLVGSVLPVKLFQPAYTIDAETQILRPMARRLGLLLSGSFDEGIVLRDRSIPLPGQDDFGFRVSPAVFFPVPMDETSSRGNSYASYKPGGRPGWFISKTYEQYAIDRAVWRVTGRQEHQRGAAAVVPPVAIGAAVPPHAAAGASNSGVVNGKLAASR